MSYQFHEDFACHDEDGKPYNIQIERNSDFAHGHSSVIDKRYHVLVCGNKHLAQTPPLADFNMELALAVATPCFEASDAVHKPGFRVFFRYDRFRKEGYLLECAFVKQTVQLELSSLGGQNEKVLLKEAAAPLGSGFDHLDFKATMEVKGGGITFKVGGATLEIADDNQVFTRPGQVGLDKTFYHGELVVKEWRVTAEGDFKRAPVLGPLSFALPCTHGMSVPLRYTLAAFKYEDGPYELDITLSGGIKDRPDRGKSAGQWCHEMDMLKNPYVRVDSPTGEIRNILLLNGLTTLLDREEKRVWVVDKYGDTKWPLERRVCFEDLPALASLRFASGYEFYMNEPKRFLAGGPFEVVGDSRGNLLYQGQPLRRGEVALSVKSPEDKLLCALIPAGIPDREKALAHVRDNHYFLEKERVRFDIKIHYHAGLFFAEELALSAQLQSVYGDILKNEVRLSPPTRLSNAQLGVEVLSREAEVSTPLAPGLYHLVVKLALGARPLQEEQAVVEIMSTLPDAAPPPAAAGLPLLFSDTSETKYLETDAFDPLCERAGAMHYFSICHARPDYVRDKRLWELLKLYRRKWYLGLTSRETGGDLSVEGNRDIIEQCDFVQLPFENSRFGRYDLWKHDHYKDEVIVVLLDFFKANPELLKFVSLESLEEARAKGDGLPEKLFMELVGNCWKEWLRHFAAWFAATLKRQHDQLKAINGGVGRATGGPFPVYASHNKAAYFVSYFGHVPGSGTERYFDGFWQFEDYPEACGYSVTRAVFALMSMKLCYPSWRLFPEIYAALIDGCNDGAVSQAHPPFGFYDVAASMIEERVYEYAFAAAWFKAGRFQFWSDYGFHFNMRHGKAGFAALLGAWGKVRRHQPARPVRTTCFLADVGQIAKHPDYYERNCNVHTVWKDVINTAEEALVHTYAAARAAGLPAGFVTTFGDLGALDASMTDLIVIPPLGEDVPQEHLDALRRLHRQGVSLLGFEDVHGLEDLFGVKRSAKGTRVRKVGAEFAEHELCAAYYESDGASSVLLGAETPDGACDIPVLLSNRTEWGRTAFFNIPPTVLKRDSFIERIGYGQECVSAVMKRAFDHILRTLSDPVASAPGAKLIAFQDTAGELVVIVEEEALGRQAYPRTFLLALKLPGVKPADIACDQAYSVARETPEGMSLRVSLGKYESAFFKIKLAHTN